MVDSNLSRNDLHTKLAQKKAEVADVKAKADNLAEDIRAIERVLSMFPNGTVGPKELSPTVNITASELRDMRTQKEALDYIAEKHEGRVKVGIAKQLLIDAGLVKGDPKNAYGHIYNILKGDEEYEFLGNAEFQKKQGSLAIQ